MKKIHLFLITLILTSYSYSQVKTLTNQSTFFDFIEEYTSQNGDSIPVKQIKRLEKIWGAKLAPSGDCTLAGQAYYEYAQNYESYQTNSYEPNWEELGPIGTNTVATNGQIHNSIFYKKHDKYHCYLSIFFICLH